MYRLLLINPAFRFKHYAAQDELSRLLGRSTMTLPLSLPLLAALTPDNYEIKIINDELEELPEQPVPDLVGITTLNATIDRVYEIADFYRSKGSVVVLGGSYVAFKQEEALEHADSVVVGEAERTWGTVLKDFETGSLQPVYRADEPPTFEASPLPRWDLVNPKSFMTLPVETSRGCPYDCDFCLVNKMFGRRMRFRAIDDVVAEIESLPLNRIFFVADNFAQKKSYARELVEKLAPLNLSWVCQGTIDIAEDMELLKAMAKAGCMSILIGFESLNPSNLEASNKKHNLAKDYEEAIARIHSEGIHVLASLIVGFDGDTGQVYDDIFEFVQKNNLLFPMLNTLTVAPGTDIYDRMKKEGRLADVDQGYYNGMFPCIHYNKMSQREILDSYFNTLRQLFDPRNVRQRAMGLFSGGAFSRRSHDKVGFFEKLTTSSTLLRNYLLTGNRDKRRLFLSLAKLVKQKKLSPDNLVIFLLNMQAFNDFLSTSDGYIEEVRRTISMTDKGPWEAQ